MKIKNDKLLIQVICLVTSIILWVVVMIDTNPILENNYTNVPVTIRNISALENSNMVLMNRDKDNFTVNIKVKGTRDQLNGISKGDFSAYIDVIGFQEGVSNAKVEVTGPSGVEIDSYYPTKIVCDVESVISRIMDVAIQYQGKEAQNYYRANGAINPTTVKITGPRSIVNSAQAAIATVDVEGAQNTVIKTVPVRVFDGTDTEIFMTSPIENVRATVPIYPTKYVPLEATIKGEPSEGFVLSSATVKPERVKIAATQDVLNSISSIKLEELDITGANKNILSSKEVINEKKVTILDLDTKPVVSAVIENVIEKSFTYNIDDVEFVNLPDGYEINLDSLIAGEKEIIATVSGADSKVNLYSKDDIKLTADLSEVNIGLNTIEIGINTNKDSENITLSNEVLNIEIIESENLTPTEG